MSALRLEIVKRPAGPRPLAPPAIGPLVARARREAEAATSRLLEEASATAHAVVRDARAEAEAIRRAAETEGRAAGERGWASTDRSACPRGGGAVAMTDRRIRRNTASRLACLTSAR